MGLEHLALLPLFASSLPVRSSSRINPCSFHLTEDVATAQAAYAPDPLIAPETTFPPASSAAATWQWVLNHYLQPSPRTHTFKTIPPTTQPTTTTTPAPPSTSTPLHSFPAYDRYDHSKNCPCKYSQSLDADERITMDKGPYFYLLVNRLPPNEQRRKRACGLCSEGNHIASSKQREAAARLSRTPAVFGSKFRSSCRSTSSNMKYERPLVGASYPYSSSPSLYKPIAPPTLQLASQFPVIHDWMHIRPILG